MLPFITMIPFSLLIIFQAIQGAPVTQDDAGGVQLGICNETWQFNVNTNISDHHFVVADESNTYPINLKDDFAAQDQYPVWVKQDITQTSQEKMPTVIYTPRFLLEEQKLIRIGWKDTDGVNLIYRFFNVTADSACRVKYPANLGELMDAVYTLPTEDDLAVATNPIVE
jgi:hypothetical protein